jgi:nucleotide-binding universal stress UspA family protein
MATKIIISYDGTNNENDAIALGRVFARAGAETVLAYVRHTQEPEPDREQLVQEQAEALLEKGAELFGQPGVAREVVSDRSTPVGLKALAERIGADVIVFCSDSHTATGRVSVGNSAARLLEGGPVAIAIAPARLAETHGDGMKLVAAVGDGADDAAAGTAASLADALGASVVPAGGGQADLLVVGSRPEAREGTVGLTAASENLIEEARSAVLVVPRSVTLNFARRAAAVPA